MLNLLVLALTAVFVLPSAASAVTLDCSEVDGEVAVVWPHPARPELAAVLCRHDPLPGWWDSLWIVDTARRDGPRIIRVPLHGTGVAHFSWLDCPGPALAHVVDRTHMGTTTDQVLRVETGGRVQVVESSRLPRGALSVRRHVPCLP